jgi:ATP-binding cassette subfamily B protein
VIVALAAGQAAIRVLSRVFIFNAAREAEYELRRDLFARLCRLDAGFYAELKTGDLLSRLTNDITALRSLIGVGVLHVVNTAFAYAVALPLMVRIDAQLTLLALLPYPLLLLAARAFAHGIYRRSQGLQQSLAAMSSTVAEDLASIREIKAHVLEEWRGAEFELASREYRERALALARFRTGLVPVVGLGAGLSLVIVLGVGGARAISGALTLGDLVGFSLYIALLAWPTMSIGWMLSLWQRGLAAWERLRAILDRRSPLEADGAAGGDTADLPAAPFAIELRGASVTLGARRVLEDVSLVIPAGTMTAAAGRLGSGKSTLAEVVARLLDVPPGTLHVGGRDAATLPVGWLRRQIAYAPQQAFLFSATVAENIAVGLPEGSDPTAPETRGRIAEAAQAAGLGPDLAGFPHGLDTLVGERGLSLSGGQRQRVALARALVAGRPILILDDSLSAVDADTERAILEGLGQVLRGRTVLLVSHRLSALRHADQVVVLDEGRVVERGRPDELLAADGLYATIYRQQLLQEGA